MNWEYLAGFFDGEGNINLIKVKKWYFFQVRIYNTNEEILKEIVNFLAYGRVYHRRRSDRRNDMYELYLAKKEYVQKFLEGVYPFLIIKKSQANFVLDCLKEGVLNDKNLSKGAFKNFVTRKIN